MRTAKSGFFVFGLVCLVTRAIAIPPPPPPALDWIKYSWTCSGRDRSSIEIERRRLSGKTQMRFTELRIDAKNIPSAAIEGLDAYVADAKFVRAIAGYCSPSGAYFNLEALGRDDPDPRNFKWKQFYVPYDR